MAENGWKRLNMAENGWKRLKTVKNNWNNWKQLKMAEKGWKQLSFWVSQFPSYQVCQFPSFQVSKLPSLQVYKRQGSGRWAEGERKVSGRGAEGTLLPPKVGCCCWSWARLINGEWRRPPNYFFRMAIFNHFWAKNAKSVTNVVSEFFHEESFL